MSKWGKVKVKVLGRGGVNEQEHMVKVRQNTQSQSWGDKNKCGRTLASMMTTTCTSSTIKWSEVVMKIKDEVGTPMPKTESTKLNQKVECRQWHKVYSIEVDDA